MIRVMIAALMAFVLTPGLANSAALIDDLAGRWSGQSIDAPGGDIPVDVIDIEIRPGSGGFELAWKDLTRDEQGAPAAGTNKARFVETSRKGVFEVAPEEGSFLDRMFASPATGNPLDGETLLWARTDDQTLAVYSLKIGEDGEFDLDHYSWTRTDDGLLLRFREQTEELGKETSIEGRLVPGGR